MAVRYNTIKRFAVVNSNRINKAVEAQKRVMGYGITRRQYLLHLQTYKKPEEWAGILERHCKMLDDFNDKMEEGKEDE